MLQHSGEVLAGPDVINRGFVFGELAEPIMEEARHRTLLTLKESASQEVSDQTVLDWIHGGRLFAAQIGPRLFRIPLASLMQFLGVPPRIRWTRGRKARRIDDAEFERLEPARATRRVSR